MISPLVGKKKPWLLGVLCLNWPLCKFLYWAKISLLVMYGSDLYLFAYGPHRPRCHGYWYESIVRFSALLLKEFSYCPQISSINSFSIGICCWIEPSLLQKCKIWNIKCTRTKIFFYQIYFNENIFARNERLQKNVGNVPCPTFKALFSFPALRLFQSLEYDILCRIENSIT